MYVCLFISIATPTANVHVPEQLGMSFPNPTDSNFPDDNFECSGFDDSMTTATPILKNSSSFYSSNQLQDALTS